MLDETTKEVQEKLEEISKSKNYRKYPDSSTQYGINYAERRSVGRSNNLSGNVHSRNNTEF